MGDPLGVGGQACQVVAFLRVFPQVEELLAPAAAAPDVLLPPIRQPLLGLTEDRVLAVQVIAPRRSSPRARGRKLAPSTDVGMGSPAHSSSVGITSRSSTTSWRAPAACCSPAGRPGSSARGRSLVAVGLARHVVVAQHLPVVGGEADVRVARTSYSCRISRKRLTWWSMWVMWP